MQFNICINKIDTLQSEASILEAANRITEELDNVGNIFIEPNLCPSAFINSEVSLGALDSERRAYVARANAKYRGQTSWNCMVSQQIAKYDADRSAETRILQIMKTLKGGEILADKFYNRCANIMSWIVENPIQALLSHKERFQKAALANISPTYFSLAKQIATLNFGNLFENPDMLEKLFLFTRYIGNPSFFDTKYKLCLADATSANRINNYFAQFNKSFILKISGLIKKRKDLAYKKELAIQSQLQKRIDDLNAMFANCTQKIEEYRNHLPEVNLSVDTSINFAYHSGITTIDLEHNGSLNSISMSSYIDSIPNIHSPNQNRDDLVLRIYQQEKYREHIKAEIENMRSCILRIENNSHYLDLL